MRPLSIHLSDLAPPFTLPARKIAFVRDAAGRLIPNRDA
jgi:hypothetical protein